MSDIICIGVVGNIEVNVFSATMFKDGERIDRPCVEIRRMNSVQMHLSEVEEVIDLLQEAVAFWREEGM